MRIFPVIVALFWAANVAEAAAQDSYCPAVESAMEVVGQSVVGSGAPGIVIGVQTGAAPMLIRAYGQADLEHATAMTPDSVFRIASLTKQFTAVLVLDLVRGGLIDVNTPAAHYLSDRSWLGNITVYQLLVQTSGLPEYADVVAGDGSEALARTPAQMLDLIGSLGEPIFMPGERWAYSNSNYVVLGAIIEQVTGRPFAEVMEERILQPAGLGLTAFDDPSDVVSARARGYSAADRNPLQVVNAGWIHSTLPGPAGGMRSTAGDLLAWSVALYGGRILPSEDLATLTAPGVLDDGRTTRFGMPDAWREGLHADYAMGLFVSQSTLGPRLWHGGSMPGFSTWLAYFPEADTGIVILMNGDYSDFDATDIEDAIAGGCRPANESIS